MRDEAVAAWSALSGSAPRLATGRNEDDVVRFGKSWTHPRAQRRANFRARTRSGERTLQALERRRGSQHDQVGRGHCFDVKLSPATELEQEPNWLATTDTYATQAPRATLSPPPAPRGLRGGRGRQRARSKFLQIRGFFDIKAVAWEGIVAFLAVPPMNVPSALVDKFKGFRSWALRFELRVAPTESQRLFALTVVIGVVCGLAAVLFHFSIRFAEGLLFDRAITAPGDRWIVWGVVTPALGGLVAGLLLKYVFPNARGSGVPQSQGRLRLA